MLSLSSTFHIENHDNDDDKHKYNYKFMRKHNTYIPKPNNHPIRPSLSPQDHSHRQKIHPLQRLRQDPALSVRAITMVQAVEPRPVRRRPHRLRQQRVRQVRDPDAAPLAPQLAAQAALQQGAGPGDPSAVDGQSDAHDREGGRVG